MLLIHFHDSVLVAGSKLHPYIIIIPTKEDKRVILPVVPKAVTFTWLGLHVLKVELRIYVLGHTVYPI